MQCLGAHRLEVQTNVLHGPLEESIVHGLIIAEVFGTFPSSAHIDFPCVNDCFELLDTLMMRVRIVTQTAAVFHQRLDLMALFLAESRE